MTRLIRKANQYNVQILDDNKITGIERDSREIQFTVSVTGSPVNKEQMINFAIPIVQRFLVSRYGFLSFDKLSLENFNSDKSRINPDVPNTIDFPVIAYFTAG